MIDISIIDTAKLQPFATQSNFFKVILPKKALFLI